MKEEKEIKRINVKEAIKAITLVKNYCNQIVMCQNCVFHIDKPDRWECQLNMKSFDLEEVEYLYDRKKKNNGYI